MKTNTKVVSLLEDETEEQIKDGFAERDWRQAKAFRDLENDILRVRVLVWAAKEAVLAADESALNPDKREAEMAKEWALIIQDILEDTANNLHKKYHSLA